MADITVTAANVAKGSDASIVTGTAGAAITAGQPVYMDASDSNSIKPADADASTAAAAAVGIALHTSADGQPITYQTGGSINLGATLTVGETYIVSSAAGGICPIGDLGNPERLTYLGYASTTSNLVMTLNATGVTRAA